MKNNTVEKKCQIYKNNLFKPEKSIIYNGTQMPQQLLYMLELMIAQKRFVHWYRSCWYVGMSNGYQNQDRHDWCMWHCGHTISLLLSTSEIYDK